MAIGAISISARLVLVILSPPGRIPRQAEPAPPGVATARRSGNTRPPGRRSSAEGRPQPSSKRSPRGARRPRRREAEVRPGARRQHPPARRALDQPLLQQEGLDHLLDGVAHLRERRRDRLHPHRPAAVVLGEEPQVAPVRPVEPEVVDPEPHQRPVGDLPRDLARRPRRWRSPPPAAAAARRSAACPAPAGRSRAPRPASPRPSSAAPPASRSGPARPRRRTRAASGCRTGRAAAWSAARAASSRPTSVNGCSSSRTVRAAGPSPMTRSSWKSSSAG